VALLSEPNSVLVSVGSLAPLPVDSLAVASVGSFAPGTSYMKWCCLEISERFLTAEEGWLDCLSLYTSTTSQLHLNISES